MDFIVTGKIDIDYLLAIETNLQLFVSPNIMFSIFCVTYYTCSTKQEFLLSKEPG